MIKIRKEIIKKIGFVFLGSETKNNQSGAHVSGQRMVSLFFLSS